MHNPTDRSYTHVERGATFTDKLKSNLFATLVGVILIPAGLMLLGWNEVG